MLHVLVLVCLLAAVGCGGKKKTTARRLPPPPPVNASAPPAATPAPAPDASLPYNIPPDAEPIHTEEGLASWYGPPYHNRKAANGEIYDMHAATAAHKTLPLGSIVRVTNVKTGRAAIVRINDRGPFIGERIIDLSLAAAKAIDVWRPGVARVRVDVLYAPKPLDTGGRWAVQIGAFKDAAEAAELKEKLLRRYSTAKVLQFSGPTGDWVRVRVLQDDRKRAFEIARDTRLNRDDAGVFVVRLD